MTTKTKFDLGRILITPNAQSQLNPFDVMNATLRHAACDWGECEAQDRHANDDALIHSGRIFSVYRDRSGLKFWIITEAGRHATTILLPEDY